MRKSGIIKWLQLGSGFLLIIMVMVWLPLLYPRAMQQQIEDEKIDAGALFYSESPQALENAYRLQKLHKKP